MTMLEGRCGCRRDARWLGEMLGNGWKIVSTVAKCRDVRVRRWEMEEGGGRRRKQESR